MLGSLLRVYLAVSAGLRSVPVVLFVRFVRCCHPVLPVLYYFIVIAQQKVDQFNVRVLAQSEAVPVGLSAMVSVTVVVKSYVPHSLTCREIAA